MAGKTSKTSKKVLIVGGGFGGVRVARRLAKRPDLSVALVSDRDYFAYYPQLYHAATGGARSESALPLSSLFANMSVELTHGTVVSFNPRNRTVVLSDKRSLPYDYLVLALGNVTNYFGIKGLAEYSFTIKTIEGAERFKRHLHQEIVEQGKTEAAYVIVGAGPTGIELAGALSQYLPAIARKHGITYPRYTIDLVEAAPRVLPRSAPAVSARVERRLRKLGINVMTGAVVEGESANKLKLKGKTITTQTVVWTAGVANNPFFKQNVEHFTLAKNGRVEADTHLQSGEGIYILGDNANTPFTGLAQTAISDANFVAADIIRRLDRRLRVSYRPKRPTAVTPVGRGWAVVEWGPLHCYGYIGWLLRRAADLVAYRDIERWPAALRVWLSESRREDDCPICQRQEPA